MIILEIIKWVYIGTGALILTGLFDLIDFTITKIFSFGLNKDFSSNMDREQEAKLKAVTIIFAPVMMPIFLAIWAFSLVCGVSGIAGRGVYALTYATSRGTAY